MRFFLLLLLSFAMSVNAATLKVEIARNGFKDAIDVAVAPRVEGDPPQWLATKTVSANKSAVTFDDLDPGLYLVLAKGAKPLERLTAKVNVGGGGATVRMPLPKSRAALQVTLAGAPVPRAQVSLIHREFRWDTQLTTDDEGRFAGALWEPAAYTVRVRPDAMTASYIVDRELSAAPLTIDVPDRHAGGRVVDDDGKPVPNAQVFLRTESGDSSLTVRTQTAPDGRFEFFGVREGAHTIFARAPSYLNSDAATFELSGARARHTTELHLARGAQRAVRIVDTHGAAVANATVLAACDGHVKSTATTDAEGRAAIALARSKSCVVYAAPKDGALAVLRVAGPKDLVLRVPPAPSSLRLALKSDEGEAFAHLRLLMRVNGAVVPPSVARYLAPRGLSLTTNEHGTLSLGRLAPGTYEFWPYRTDAEGQMLFEVAGEVEAPIVINVATGENDATVKFRARR